MRLGYFTEQAYEKLLANVGANQEMYASDEEWLPEFFHGTDYYKYSSVSVDRFTPYIAGENLTDRQKSDEDLVNVRKMYDAFIGLTPWQASNKYMWTYLCHADSELREYIRHRWLSSMRENTIQTRYFVTNSGSLLNDNALSRLWWYGYLTYDEALADPYRYTKILLTNQTICTDVIDTLNRTNRNRIQGVLLAIEQFKADINANESLIDYVRECNRSLNRYAAVTVMDYLTVDEIKSIALEFLEEARSDALNA